MLRLNIEDVRAVFSEIEWQRGIDYQKAGRVKNYKLYRDHNGYKIAAKVDGSLSQPYVQNISVQQQKAKLKIQGHCNCPLDHNCKHVAAALQAVMLDSKKTPHKTLVEESLPLELHSWLQQLDQQLQVHPLLNTASGNECLLYVLHATQKTNYWQIALELLVARLQESGSYEASKKITIEQSNLKHFFFAEDEKNSLELHRLAKKTNQNLFLQRLELTGELSDQVFELILATNRCYFTSVNAEPLQLGATCKAQFAWTTQMDGAQKLICELPEQDWQILLLHSPWYYDPNTQRCGRVEMDFSLDVVRTLLQAPIIKPAHIEKVQTVLQQRVPTLPMPEIFVQKQANHYKLVPHLHFSLTTIITKYPYRLEKALPTACLNFCYGDYEVDRANMNSIIHIVEGRQLIEIKRELQEEAAALKKLLSCGFGFLADYYASGVINKTGDKNSYLIFPEETKWPQMHYKFFAEIAPALRTAGWKITCDADYPYQMIITADDWYSEIEESAYDWFNLELGVIVDGQTINVLPLIMQLLQQFDNAADFFATLPDDEKLFLKLPDGRLLPIAVARVRGILSILTELYDDTVFTPEGKLSLHRLRASQLTELEEKLDKNISRVGGAQLREWGYKLSQFKGIAQIAPPENFHAELRSYQQEGLNWLQFLREFNLAGILADDMGLGKTIQTLAHILVEKNQQRLDKPCLIIAPTSLMMNWYLEARRFAPDLRVLILQGVERKQYFDVAQQYDVILTTYALLPRDQEYLLQHSYHLLILDEAHGIKNPKAQATQIVQKIIARHRLCLTGTPLENHLGELWSLYHFLLPGLLLDNRQFVRLFRTPIEKHNDSERRLSLIKRIAPFLLRRTKQAVVKELPPKTEIVRVIELENKQQDLYESIRLAMHEKVQQAIRERGVGKSHIIILDALLKLRQVCCDPRLLKLDSAKKIEAESAKLNYLREVLPNLLAEGRRILLFSQFTEMLSLIEEVVRELNIEYVKLTGQTLDRATPIQKFQNGEVPLFLISLKAGGVGLNLTAADTVIHYDPWWNPAVENQATDRAYRIGQDKPVFVYKLLTKNTVEEKILTMQQKKQALLEDLFLEQNNSKATLSLDDLNVLFEFASENNH